MIFYDYKGKVYSQTQMAQLAGLSIGGFRRRIRNGWDIDKIMTTPAYENGRQANLDKKLGVPSLPKKTEKKERAIKPVKFYEYNGKRYNLTEITEMTNISMSGVRRRIRNGWSMEDIIKTPSYGKEQSYRPPLKYACEINGETISVRRLSELTGVSTDTIYHRLVRGQTLQQVADDFLGDTKKLP